MNFLCMIPLLASLFGACATPEPLAVGYVEGEYVLLAPIDPAQVRSVAVRRGERVEAGQTVAVLESADAEIAVAEAEAALAEAKAELANLKQGKRPEELAVLEAALKSAEAQLQEAERKLDRTRELNGQGIATQAELDQAMTAAELAAAEVRQAEAELAVARLPARTAEIRAAQTRVRQAQANLEMAEWRLAERSLEAPVSGRIDDVIRNPGDIAGPSAPVVSMLPDGAVKLKLYVPEPMFADIAVGTELQVRCDGCPPDLAARVSYVAPDPEFTPPVIYSLDTRQKLVYLVEARPEDDSSVLKPGQIVDVVLEPAGERNGGVS